MSKQNILSLLICSNRKNVLFAKIWSKVRNNGELQKIVLATQRQANLYKNGDHKVVHLKLDTVGRSKAFNAGLKEIKTGLVGITDDDCFLDGSWTKQVQKTLSDPTIGLVYGQTKAYKPENNKNKTCPCTFSKSPNKKTVTSRLGRHWIDVGFDNNTAIKKAVFDKIGGYKWWLGPGAIGVAAEDAEFILRALLAKIRIAYNPSMIVYHNKWLGPEEEKQQTRVYLCGGIAAYGFYYFQGVKECRSITISQIIEVFTHTKNDVRSYVKKPYSPAKLLRNIFLNFYYLFLGLFIAFIFAKVIPIPEKENVVKKYYKNK